jgi:hypothetical protein
MAVDGRLTYAAGGTGWRSLRLFLLLSPRGLFLYPGAAIFLLGLAGTLMLLAGDVVLGNIAFAERTMVITAAAINVGFEVMLFWMFATTVAVQRSLLPRDILRDCDGQCH